MLVQLGELSSAPGDRNTHQLTDVNRRPPVQGTPFAPDLLTMCPRQDSSWTPTNLEGLQVDRPG